MDYIELNVTVADAEQGEIVMAQLADFPFDSFVQEGVVLKAYIPMMAIAECKAEVDAVLDAMELRGAYIEIETQNWNALWEASYEPVDVEGKCRIRAPFSPAPPAGWLDVVIMPKMSFGTGHHATTWLCTAELMARNLTGLDVLDIGSGTGVLSIVAALRGARHIDAVDIDEWADENCRENAATNGVARQITSILGDVRAVEGRTYDLIVANINRNILLTDMPHYAAMLRTDGTLIMSGILESDVDPILDRASSLGLTLPNICIRDGWAAICVRL